MEDFLDTRKVQFPRKDGTTTGQNTGVTTPKRLNLPAASSMPTSSRPASPVSGNELVNGSAVLAAALQKKINRKRKVGFFWLFFFIYLFLISFHFRHRHYSSRTHHNRHHSILHNHWHPNIIIIIIRRHRLHRKHHFRRQQFPLIRKIRKKFHRQRRDNQEVWSHIMMTL